MIVYYMWSVHPCTPDIVLPLSCHCKASTPSAALPTLLNCMLPASTLHNDCATSYVPCTASPPQLPVHHLLPTPIPLPAPPLFSLLSTTYCLLPTPYSLQPLWFCCSIAGRLMRQFTELRQCCCHPQIVRTSDSMLGRDRLSMQDIIARLTAKAYSEYDQAARAHTTARLLQAAVAIPAGHRPSECACICLWQSYSQL